MLGGGEGRDCCASQLWSMLALLGTLHLVMMYADVDTAHCLPHQLT